MDWMDGSELVRDGGGRRSRTTTVGWWRASPVTWSVTEVVEVESGDVEASVATSVGWMDGWMEGGSGRGVGGVSE